MSRFKSGGTVSAINIINIFMERIFLWLINIC